MECTRLEQIYGETLKEEGIILSGHKFASKDNAQDSRDKNMKTALSENITFIKNPLEGLMEIIANRGYNNYGRGGSNDIMLIRIPTDKLEANSQDIVIQKTEDSAYLNPQYIQGFVRIDVEKGTFKDFVGEDSIQPQKSDYALEATLKKFSQKPATSKLAEIKQKAVNIFKQLLRPKEKENGKGRD